MSDGSRNVGAVYGFDTFTLTPAVAVTLRRPVLPLRLSGRERPFQPARRADVVAGEHFRLNALASSRALAPGAEEFLPPIDIGLWLPPQRTFSSIVEGRRFEPERTDHVAIQAERDFGASTVSVRAFRQQVDRPVGDDVRHSSRRPRPARSSGTTSSATPAMSTPPAGAQGFGRRSASRVHGSVEYSQTRARWSRARRTGLSGAGRAFGREAQLDRVHDLSTAIETNVPETSTRILVIFSSDQRRRQSSARTGRSPIPASTSRSISRCPSWISAPPDGRCCWRSGTRSMRRPSIPPCTTSCSSSGRPSGSSAV